MRLLRNIWRGIVRIVDDIYRGFVRVVGFFLKELTTVLRQPRLIASLVLGPFAILILFGMGYRGEQPEFQTILVVPPDPSISTDPAVYREAFSGVFKLQEITRDEAQARAQLERGRAAVVIVVPANIFEELNAGRPATLPVYYSETDPSRSAWVRYFAYVQVTELNRRILTEVVRQSKGPAAQALEYTELSRQEVDGLSADLQSGNYVSAAARTGRLLVATQTAKSGIAAGLDALGQQVAPAAAAGAGAASDRLNAIEYELLALQSDLARGPAGAATAQQRVTNIRTHVNELDQIAQQINRIPPETIVSPFEAEARNVVPIEPTPIAFYTPAVIALLIQHMGVMLGALSSVRDRLLGATELFRVSPVSAANILVGKTLGYGLLLALVSLLLSSAATLLLKVPSLGQPVEYWTSIGLTIFASVALGFALSIVAKSESQAVQLAMLILLASVFFGGFFLPIDQLFPWVQPLSYALPVTYGTIDLRDVMLRGVTPAWIYLVAPLGLGLFFYVVAMLGLNRQMRRAG